MTQMGVRKTITSLSPLFVFLVLCSFLMTGCLFRARVEPPLATLSIQEVWSRFQELQAVPPLQGKGCRLKASLNYFSPQQSHRLVLDLWGNYSLPLRLNLKAGFGRTVAMWRVDKGQWLGYVPDKQRAYTHPDSRTGVSRMGVASPFDLQELLFLFSGQWQEVLPRVFEQGEPLRDRGYEYTLARDNRVRSLILDRTGRPREIQGRRGTGWSMRFSEYARVGKRWVPFRVHLKNTNQEEILIHIKEIEPVRSPWSKSSLKLELPEQTRIIELES